MTKFLSIRTVKGGAVWNNEYLGRVVRWYHSSDGASIHYKINGNKVPKTDGSTPLMQLQGKLSFNLDKQWYEDECISILDSLGAYDI